MLLGARSLPHEGLRRFGSSPHPTPASGATLRSGDVLLKPVLFGLAVLALVPAASGRRAVASHAQGLGTYVTQLGKTHFPTGGATESDSGDAVVALRSGAVLVAGTTYSTLGEAHAGPSTEPDVFLARFDPQGELDWIRQLGATTAPAIPKANGDPAGPGGDASGADRVGDLAVDADGSIYVTGSTSSSLGETNGGGDDVFLAKFDEHGSLLWLRQIGAETKASFSPPVQASKLGDVSGSDVASSILIDPSGAVYVAGHTSGDLAEKNGTTSYQHDRDVFLARFSAEGRLEWLRQMGATSSPKVGFDTKGHDRTADIALQPSGSIVLASASEFSYHYPDGFTSYGTYVALVTFDSHGRPIASRSLPGTDREFAAGVAVESPSGRIFLAGTTRGYLGEAGGGGSQTDVYVATFHADLDLQWIRQIGQTAGVDLGLKSIAQNEKIAGIVLDSAGDLILAGWTLGSLSEPNAKAKTSDVFLAKFDTQDGEFVWVAQFGKTTSELHGFGAKGDEVVGGLALGSDDTIVLTGGTTGNLGDFKAGSSDVFVMRLAPDGTL